MRKTLSALALALCTTASLTPARAQPVNFELIQGFATKTGLRGVVAWQTSEPIAGYVEWGASPGTLSEIALPFGNLVDQAQMALLELGEDRIGQTIYYRIVVDEESGEYSPTRSFVAQNAYENYDGEAGSYTLNALVQIDSPDPEALTGANAPWNLGLEDVAQAVNVLAERLYDALDGHARVGRVLITDTPLDNPPSLPFSDTVCLQEIYSPTGDSLGGTPADVLIQTTVPFDSHTWSDWAIERPCTGLYIGRLGQLVVPWEDDLHLGYVMTHEFMHYAFNAPDLYPEADNTTPEDDDGPEDIADCKNAEWDGSLMHNTGGWNRDTERWELTELDRNQTLTPCAHGNEPWTWTVLREKYKSVPEATAPQDVHNQSARGNPDGGALEIYILQHGPGQTSTLTRYTPDDTP